MTTITASTTVGVNLNPALYTSPVVIDAGIAVSNPGYPYAVYRHSGAVTVFAIENGGTISASGVGVYLAPGGSVTNAAAASITGGSGVKISDGGGIVVNDGDIAGTGSNGRGVYITGGAGTVVNAGSIAATGANGVGVRLTAGGSVTNAVSASISSVDVSGGAGTVVNYGSFAHGVDLGSGGSVTNAAAGTIKGIEVSGGAGTVVNGAIVAGGVSLTSGGSVTNSATITGEEFGIRTAVVGLVAGTVVNYGYIGATLGYGLDLEFGGLVSNAATGLIAGTGGVLIDGASGAYALVNAGRILGAGVNAAGVVLESRTEAGPGSVSNATSGSISGGDAGVYAVGDATVLNYGGIAAIGTGTLADGVFLHSGGTITNAASGSISGRERGVEAVGGSGGDNAALVVNDGAIVGTLAFGVYLQAGGTVTNATSADITGGTFGVELASGGALTNAGTIVGNGGTAVAFGGTGSNLLVLDPGFSFSGMVIGGLSASNTLELASAASRGAIGGLGTQYLHLPSIVFDAGAEWSISGVQRGLAGTISGFALGDTIEVDGVTAQTSSFSDGTLTLHETVGSATLYLPGSFTSATDFHVTPNSDGTEVTVACFRAGARILTVSGEVAVEELQIGDQVVTVRGCQLAPIVWLGHRHVDCVGHPRPEDVWPIRIKAGAIADGVPHRDLWLSPEHAVLLRDEAEDVLVPVRHLVNGTTIAQAPCACVTYWHVELASHDVIVAEGLPAETYLDTGNRSDFANGGPAMIAHPTFADAVWRAKACAPQLRHGDALVALQRRLAIRGAECAGDRLRANGGLP